MVAGTFFCRQPQHFACPGAAPGRFQREPIKPRRRAPKITCSERFLKLVAQAFQPVSRKQVSRAQPGKAVPPVNTSFSGFTDEPKAHGQLFRKLFRQGLSPPPQRFLKFYLKVPIRKSAISTPPTKANSTERGGRKVSDLKPAG